MEISLTKSQYKTLLTVVYCGEWMLNSFKTREDKMQKDTDELEQLLFAKAKEMGLSNWVEYDEELGRYFPTLRMEETLQKYLDKYDHHRANRPFGYMNLF